MGFLVTSIRREQPNPSLTGESNGSGQQIRNPTVAGAISIRSPRTRDIITTERCNAVLRQIATANPGYLKTVVWSDHAHAILETMEAFHPLTKPDDFLSQRRAMSFPTPDLQTYQMVVDIDSRTEGPLEIALRAQRTIEQLYLLYKEGGNVDLKPTKFMWTMVFMTWKQCTDPESPAHAGTLLLRLFNEQPGDLSMASVAAVLTTCAKVYNDDTSSTLGSRIAIKICQHSLYNLEDQLGESPKSQFYTVFFRALRSVSTADKMRAQYFASVFDHACRRGKVNSLVLAAFMSNASDNELMVRYFGEDVQLLTGLPIEDATAILLNKMPLEWKENAD